MTREEAKEYLMNISYQLGTMSIEHLSEKDGDKMREAIKALKQEPCTDAISRANTIDEVSRIIFDHPLDGYEDGQLILKTIQDMPPVTPAEKVGHWVYDDDCREHGHCSECGYGSIDIVDGKLHNYCQSCGARMQEVEDADID